MAKQTKGQGGIKQAGKKRRISANNPFENATHRGGIRSNKRAKHEVINRKTSHKKTWKDAQVASETSKTRQSKLVQHIRASKKSNTFRDNRIDGGLNRVIKERSNQSKRLNKYQLENDHELTHAGQAFSENPAMFSASSRHFGDDDDSGDGYDKLDAVDTEMHFGGGGISKSSEEYNAYGGGGTNRSLGEIYRSRKSDLDEVILRSKMAKQERQKEKQEQVELFEKADADYGELKGLLKFRAPQSRGENTSVSDKTKDDMDDWNAEMKSYLFERRIAATDRTKTPEEIAKEEAEHLHDLEKKRLARMAGEDDDLSDVEVSDEESDGEEEVVFTEDGLIRMKNGKVVNEKNKDGEVKPSHSEESEDDEEDDDDNGNVPSSPLKIGQKVKANYHASEAYLGVQNWFKGEVISRDTKEETYTIKYDDGDVESGVKLDDIRLIESGVVVDERVREKAKRIARKEMPYVFTVPANIDELHDLIGEHCKSGKDVGILIERIYVANSVRVNKTNMGSMVNFLDILQKRFMLIAEALASSGDSESVRRSHQLNSLCKIMYKITREAPSQMSQIWSRNLIYFQRNLVKKLNDIEIGVDTSAVPGIGQILLIRLMMHIFPVTDYKHVVCTPMIILLGQYLAQAPVSTLNELHRSIFVSSLMLEYTKGTGRICPESIYFLKGVLELMIGIEDKDQVKYAFPTFHVKKLLDSFLESNFSDECDNYSLKVHVPEDSQSSLILVILMTSLKLISKFIVSVEESKVGIELLSQLRVSLKRLRSCVLPSSVAALIKQQCVDSKRILKMAASRKPIQRRTGPMHTAIQTYAPNMVDPDSYKMSKDKSKSQQQASHARLVREYKREHKAVQRELRIDASIIENQRREEKSNRDSAAQAKRHKNFAWMEHEQSVMNQQVRQGGGLLSGGGIGAARAKVRKGALGIKKGGKMSI